MFKNIFTNYKRKSITKKKVYFIGLPKTASLSLAQMIQNSSDVHEFWFGKTIIKLYKYSKNEITKNDLIFFLEERERAKTYRYDISTFNYKYYTFLLERNPDSLFLLPLRDPYSWINSFLNHIRHHLNEEGSSDWFDDSIKYYFNENFSTNDFLTNELISENIEELIKLLCKEWNNHILTLFLNIPKTGQTLIYRYSLLADDLNFITDFLGLKIEDLSLKNRFENVGTNKFDFLNTNKKLFNNYINRYCHDAYAILKEFGIDSISKFNYTII